MCCCNPFRRKKKNSKKHGASGGGGGFAPRPMQQVVQPDGRVSYKPAAAAPTHPEYGAQFDADVEKTKGRIEKGAKIVSYMGPQGRAAGTVVKHGAGFAAERYTERQYKARETEALQQQLLAQQQATEQAISEAERKRVAGMEAELDRMEQNLRS